MKTEFNYARKETYSQTDLDNILTAHESVVKLDYEGYIKPEDHEKVTSELKGFKQEKTKKLKSEFLGGIKGLKVDRFKKYSSYQRFMEAEDNDKFISELKAESPELFEEEDKHLKDTKTIRPSSGTVPVSKENKLMKKL